MTLILLCNFISGLTPFSIFCLVNQIRGYVFVPIFQIQHSRKNISQSSEITESIQSIGADFRSNYWQKLLSDQELLLFGLSFLFR